MATANPSQRRTDADKSLLSFLVRTKKVAAEHAEQVERWAASEDLSIIQALAVRGVLGEDHVASALAAGLRLPLVNLDTAQYDEDVSVYLKDETAARCLMVPLRKEAGALVVAMANPLDKEAARALEFASGCAVRPVVASRSHVLAAVERRYNLDKSLRSLLRDIPVSEGLELVQADASDVDLRSLVHEAEGAPVVKMVNLILVDAINSGASDVHVEPGPNLVQVRFRINGVLEDVLEVPKWAQNPVIARIKVMAKLDITERRIPQDGHLRARFGGKLVDFRISCLPAADGEKIVIRVLDSSTGLRALEALGLVGRDLDAIRSAIAAPEGMILVTGPTGSGKTTTLYSMIQELSSREINIVTIENPIEYQLAGVTQVEVDTKRGMTFASALRSTLRQDPDVILIGEIRDRETAQIAFQAAQTGHLVLSTLHTNDTVSSLTRLLELGVENNVLASSLLCVIAQRLVRTVCRKCTGDTSGIRQAGSVDDRVAVPGTGCASCRNTGFASRTGVYEVLTVSAAIQKQIEANSAESMIRASAQREGMSLLRQDALAKVERGLTTVEEVSRVVQVDDRERRCPQCEQAIDEKFALCPHCLFRLRLSCDSCGAPMQKQWKSCPFCGPEKSTATDRAAEPPALAPVALAPAAHAPLGTITVPEVLIVDDNEELRKLVRMTLERKLGGIHCDEAANGYEALGKIEAARPNLIILDVMMPGMGGFDVCKRLRGKLSTALIPVIMLTALGDTDSKELGFLAGTDDYISKPFERTELVARVQRLLERTYGWVRKPQPMAAAHA
jgi:type IV pilus assembly protein PilB